MAVQWDHTLPPNKRIKSIHLVKNPIGDEDEDEIEHPGEMVNFVEQEDGTKVEVNQRAVELGDEIKRDGSRIYRVVSSFGRRD
jgi:5'-nucleotidase